MSQPAMRLYQVVDDAGSLFVAARSLGDAVRRWQTYHADGGITEEDEPNEVLMIANEYELLLPAAEEAPDA